MEKERKGTKRKYSNVTGNPVRCSSDNLHELSDYKEHRKVITINKKYYK